MAGVVLNEWAGRRREDSGPFLHNLAVLNAALQPQIIIIIIPIWPRDHPREGEGEANDTAATYSDQCVN